MQGCEDMIWVFVEVFGYNEISWVRVQSIFDVGKIATYVLF